jgi:hypothetical protein
VLYAIPYFIPRLVARKTDADAVSTVKLGVALVVYPVWAMGLGGAACLLPPPFSVLAAAVAIASPFAALRWLGHASRHAPRSTTRAPDSPTHPDSLPVRARRRMGGCAALSVRAF